jgi:hypothetical protein
MLQVNFPPASTWAISILFSGWMINAMFSLGNPFTVIAHIWGLIGNPRSASHEVERLRGFPTRGYADAVPYLTVMACVTLTYAVAAPLVLAFGTLAFLSIWVVNAYSFTYVVGTRHESGGLIHKRTLFYTLIGVYGMEMLMFGLFVLARDEHGHHLCLGQTIIMVVVMLFTCIFTWRFWRLSKESTYGPSVSRRLRRSSDRREASTEDAPVASQDITQPDYSDPSLSNELPIVWVPNDPWWFSYKALTIWGKTPGAIFTNDGATWKRGGGMRIIHDARPRVREIEKRYADRKIE